MLVAVVLAFNLAPVPRTLCISQGHLPGYLELEKEDGKVDIG